MTPIEKSRAEECALEVLRLRRRARRDEIKTAWRRRVVETHPDRNGGDDSQFQLVQAAYEVAQGTATDDVMLRLLDTVRAGQPTVVADATGTGADAQSRPRRAHVKTRIVWFDAQASQQTASSKGQAVDTVQVEAAAIQLVGTDGADNIAHQSHAQDVHTVQRVRQKGRRVSYIIWSLVKLGDNEVSLPKGDFRRPGDGNEVALQFASSAEGPATVTLPEEQRAAYFPGAQSVRAHFAHGLDERP